MSEIKVILSLELPGSIMLSKQECLKNSKENNHDCYDYFQIVLGKTKNKNNKVINIAVRKSRTVKQNIKLCKEAYDYMINKNNYPIPKLKNEWKKFSINQRLKYHCKEIAEALGAINFSFEVLDD